MLHPVLRTSPLHWLAALAAVVPVAAPAAESVPPSPALTVELGAAWQLRNTAQVSNEPPNTRFKIDDLTGDGPYPAGRVVLDWPLGEKHRLRFLIAPLGIDETGTASQPIVFDDKTFAPGPLDFEGLAAPQGRAIDAALKLGYDVTPNITVAGVRSSDVTALTLRAPCEFSGFDENSHRRGRSGVRSGSSPGERVCLSPRPGKTRNGRPHRPSALSPFPGASAPGNQPSPARRPG